MKPLHIRLLVRNPDREDVRLLCSALRAAGHVVVGDALVAVPEDVSREPDFIVTEAAAQPVPESLEGAEARHLQSVLRFTHGNKRQAALLLGIARSTLLAKLRRYGLS